MLTPGNVSDMKAAPALLEHAGRMRYLLGDKGYDADRLRRLALAAGAVPVIPGQRTVSGPSATTSSATPIATPSAASRISATWPLATTSSPPTSSQALPSQPRWRSDSERVWTLD